ncbi:MAG: alkaline phosphatase family protein [Thermoplasmata archaeon]
MTASWKDLFPLAIAAVLVLVSAVPYELTYGGGGSPSGPPSARTPVQHVVEIMMENHAFDNFFGTFPGVVGFPANASVPNGTGGSVPPYWISGDSTPDLPHDRASEIADLDGGRMDGFVEEMAKYNASAPETPMGYYNATQIGGYWTLAKDFVLCDMYFQPALGPTLPNRLYAIAGSSAGLTSDTWPSTPVDLTTIFDELTAAGIPWRYYYQPGEGLPVPLHVVPLSTDPAEVKNVVPMTGLLSDIDAGALPSVTFIDPEGSNTTSEHPPQNVTVGEEWSLSIIDAIETSSLWNSTAIFLTWDEGGGFYDSVVPPVVDSLGDGFRVPMIVISPFTEGAGVDSTTLDHTSVLKFIDQNWGLPYLDARVADTQSMGLVFHFDAGSGDARAGVRTLPPSGESHFGSGTLVASTIAIAAPGSPRRPGSRALRRSGGRGSTSRPAPVISHRERA